MTAIAATQALVQECGQPAGRVIAVVARAKRRILDLYRLIGFPLPPPEHFEAMVMGMACRDLRVED
jgi:hypothetical protein